MNVLNPVGNKYIWVDCLASKLPCGKKSEMEQTRVSSARYLLIPLECRIHCGDLLKFKEPHKTSGINALKVHLKVMSSS